MKTKVLTLLLSTVFAVVGIAEESQTTMFGMWKVNWDQTAPAIQAVPEAFKHRFKSPDEFRAFVANQAKEMTLELLAYNTGVLRRGSNDRPITYRWKSAERYDCWLEIGGFFAASVGHGFKVTDASNAILTFQIEWSETIATRISLRMERQPTRQQTHK